MEQVSMDRIISGKVAFKLVDSIGLPLDIIIQELRSKKLGFNVLEFIQAAKESKNFSRKRVYRLFDEQISGLPEAAEIYKEINICVEKVYGENSDI